MAAEVVLPALKMLYISAWQWKYLIMWLPSLKLSFGDISSKWDVLVEIVGLKTRYLMWLKSSKNR